MGKVVVYIDATPLVRPKDGIGSYTAGLLEKVLDIAPSEYEFRAIAFRAERSKPKLVLERKNFSYFYLPIPRKLYSLIFKFWRLPVDILLPERPSVSWYPNFAVFPFIKAGHKIVTIHDFTYMHFPEMVATRNLSYLKRLIPYSLNRADCITTVSQTVKQEVQMLIRPKATVKVVYPELGQIPKTKKPRIDLPNKFILSVGTLEPRKNILGLIEAYTALPANTRKTYKLVLAGRKGWLDKKTFNQLGSLSARGDLVWVNSPDDSELAYLYSRASCFLFLSFYEGFGLPLVEAMQFGLPVVASDTPINREVAGSWASYASDSKSAARNLKNILDQPRSADAIKPKIIKGGSKQFLEIIDSLS